jgi:hypothetical protein
MTSLTLLTELWVPALVSAADKAPAPEDVKAGWVALAVFVALAVAVALLGVSLTRHLRKARDNAEQGVFGPTDKQSENHS